MPLTEEQLKDTSRLIPLGHDRYAKVDAKDFERISAMKWCASFDNKHYYAMRRHKVEENKYQNLKMHRFILNAPKGKDVDHINHDTLDNRKINLRVCTRGQNKINSVKKANNTSGYKGVQLRSDRKTPVWRAVICKEGQITNLGQFKSITEAAEAYNKAARELHGEFACLNTITYAN